MSYDGLDGNIGHLNSAGRSSVSATNTNDHMNMTQVPKNHPDNRISLPHVSPK